MAERPEGTDIQAASERVRRVLPENLQEKELQGDHALWRVLGMSEAQEAGLYLFGMQGVGRVGVVEEVSKRQGGEWLQPDRLEFES